ncbi:unnamed protein product, partial [Candidula unifasciata]
MASVGDRSPASRHIEQFNDNSNTFADKESKIENDHSITISADKVELKKSITFLGIIAILVANIGGSGIFIFPTAILSVVGSPGMALIMWTFGGIIQAGLAFSVIEVALMFNKAGGPYYFIYHTFGNLAGFVFMWGFIIFIASPMWALGAYTTSLYLLSVVYSGCLPSDGVVKLVAAWIMLTLIAINCTYMKVVTSIQKFLTLCKVLALVIIIILGFIHIPTETGQENISHFMEGTSTDPGKIALSLFAGYIAFGGWPIITILAEEVRVPEKNIPKGLAVSFVLLIVAMVATNFAYYTVLTKEEALKSDAIAMLFGARIHPVLPVVLAILVCLCAIGTLNVAIMGQPRMIFAAGRNGHMPKMMTMLHKKFNTPWPATVSLGCLAMVMLATGSVMSLMAAASLYAGFMIVLLLLCLFTLRWKQPDKPRPLKVPLVIPVCGTLLTATLVVLSVIEKHRELGLVIFIVLLGVPVYYICVHLQKPAKLFRCI